LNEENARGVQLRIATNTARDGFNMKLIAILTALFLPGTFMAVYSTSPLLYNQILRCLQILLTTPMFNWVNPDESVIVKLPFKIYWGTTGSVTILFMIGLGLMNPELFRGTLDRVRGLIRKGGGTIMEGTV
jgi:hypothetical protein